MRMGVLAVSGKTRLHSPEGWVAVMSKDLRSYRALISSQRTKISAWRAGESSRIIS
jgi:hypothetical protein